MRKILLASAAFALFGAATALAGDSESVTVSATVTASCTLTDPDNVSFGTDPAVGANDQSDFSFSCNFGGSNTGLGAAPGGPLVVTIQSANGGLTNPGDGTPRSYTLAYNGGGTTPAASFTGIGQSWPETSSGPAALNARYFVVALAETLPVAGAYADTLTVSIVP